MNAVESELFIHPGDWYFGGEHRKVRTLLGSCVALTVWHPRLQIGGMCHYLLPKPPLVLDKGTLDPRYGIHALQLLRLAMQQTGHLSEYQLGCFGGSDMFGGRIQGRVGEMNIELAVRWLAEHRLALKHQDTGGFVSRSLVLDMKSGQVSLKRAEPDIQAGSNI
jgi:chemotaxis protein CheD